MATETPTAVAAATEIADLLVRDGSISQENVEYALRVREKLQTPRPLIAILKELGLVADDQIRKVLRANRLNVRLGTLLLELELISVPDLQAAVAIQQDGSGKRLGEILVENHFVDEEKVLPVLAAQLGYPYLDDDSLSREPKLLRRVKPAWLRSHECFPVPGDNGTVLLACRNPLEAAPQREAETIFGCPVVIGLARGRVIEAAIAMTEQGQERRPRVDTENAVVAKVNELLSTAIREGASDIHIEPMKNRVRVRFREDGVLVQQADIPFDMARAIISRIKIMAGADIAERRRHQDGRLMYDFEGAKLDLRVSFYTTIHGEKIVLRVLNNMSNLLDINELGMSPRMVQRLREDVLDVPSGVVLVTGPTGSGKTTTLYGAINYLNDNKTSIITAEDPVEYVIPGISQCSINAKIGTTYEETLRHIVRQDPDVIVIGEIRDRFSADTAIQAALTGHKVLTTFHTEDSIGGLLRLLHMDIEAFLISSTVVSVVAQRLVRRVCPHCAEEHELTSDEIRRLGFLPREVPKLVFARGIGCQECRYLGYKGRIAVFELLVLNEDVKEALINRQTSFEIRRISTETTGLVTLLEDGITKAAAGLTSFEEIIRTLPRLSKPRPMSELQRMQGVK